MIYEVKVPSPGESITEVEIESWLIEDGATVDMDAELAEINSDKATLTVNAPGAGKIQLLAKAGDTVAVGQVIAKIDAAGASAAPSAEKTPPATEQPKSESVSAPVNKENYATGTPSPSAEKLAKSKGIDTGEVAGTGRDGRITKADVQSHTPKPKAEPAKEVKPAAEIPAQPKAPAGARSQRVEKLPMLRRKIAERLVAVKNETAMLTTFNEVDMYEIMEMRKKYKDKFKEAHGVGLGFMSFFTKACTMALMEFPAVNAYINVEDKEITFHDFVDVGIAVSSERGLVVPIIRDAHLMSFEQIEAAIVHYAVKARENKITPDDMTGGTFTITNGGIFGSMLSTPILNAPQSAILGMHNIVERAVVIGGEIKVRPIMYLALSYDHRIIDGKEAVSFLVRVKERLEDPSRLLLGI
jgi:2-oxoglutarate dehydrogenase E2 component (dihydrolipoamide succinyltransferase)